MYVTTHVILFWMLNHTCDYNFQISKLLFFLLSKTTGSLVAVFCLFLNGVGFRENYWLELVAEQVPKIRVSGGTHSAIKKWVEGKLEQSFCSFLANFCCELWKIIKYFKNLVRNEEKPYSTCLQTIFGLISGSQKLDFENNRPIPPLVGANLFRGFF